MSSLEKTPTARKIGSKRGQPKNSYAFQVKAAYDRLDKAIWSMRSGPVGPAFDAELRAIRDMLAAIIPPPGPM